MSFFEIVEPNGLQDVLAVNRGFRSHPRIRRPVVIEVNTVSVFQTIRSLKVNFKNYFTVILKQLQRV